ncbi:DUF2569 family protein [Novosphingobium sp.]|uniref:DUF2569 family protein n=1 Tax=Novosphingobium sp. TaxID=1874826 RepID=UPI00286DE45E|nr:DUF2569 family protein [Novosphingobium sp.]
MAFADGDSDLRGVGGWLGLFAFGFGIVGPLRSIIETAINLYNDPAVAAALGNAWLSFQIASWLLNGLSLAGTSYVVWRLMYRQNPQTVTITIFAIPVLAFGSVLLDGAIAVTVAGIDPGTVLEISTPGLFQAAIYCAVWCWYFKVSKRVHNTYVAPFRDEEVFA